MSQSTFQHQQQPRPDAHEIKADAATQWVFDMTEILRDDLAFQEPWASAIAHEIVQGMRARFGGDDAHQLIKRRRQARCAFFQQDDRGGVHEAKGARSLLQHQDVLHLARDLDDDLHAVGETQLHFIGIHAVADGGHDAVEGVEVSGFHEFEVGCTNVAGWRMLQYTV